MAPRGADANQGETMRTYDQWMRHDNAWDVVRAAEHDEAARQAAVSRIIDTMLQVQLDYSHVRPGWPPISSTALACAAARGELLGGGHGDGDTLLIAYGRAWKGSPWHCACHYLLHLLPTRPALGMLMQAARVRPKKARGGENFWCKTAAQLLEHQDEAMRLLQLKDKGVAPFESVRTWQLHAKAAREILRRWLGNGEAQKIYQESKKSVDHAEEVGLS